MDEDGSDTTSQNESETGSHQSGGSSVSDNQNLDDKVYFGFFETVKATASEVTLVTQNSSSLLLIPSLGSMPLVPVLEINEPHSSSEHELRPEEESSNSVDSDNSDETTFQHVYVVNP